MTDIGRSRPANEASNGNDHDHNIQFTDDELSQLHLLLSQELESSRVELHHTAGLPYREFIKGRMEREEALLTKVDRARKTNAQPANHG